MRLVAADSEREAHITEIFRDVVVEAFGLLQVRGQAPGQLISFGTNFGRGHAAVFLEAGVPATELLPTFKRSELNVGAVIVEVVLLFLLVLVFVGIFALQMRTLPMVD